MTRRDPLRRGAHRPLALIADVCALAPVALTPVASHVALLTAAAWWRTRRRGGSAQPSIEPTTRFVVLIPAHDEEHLIAETVLSVTSADYPEALRRVHVVADHCSDRTATIAAAAGAEVHHHVDPEPPGKGPALQWLLAQLDARRDHFDSVVIVDADSVVNPSFFRVIDAHLRNGAAVVQANYGVRDPDTSAVTSLRSAALTLRHHLRPLGRTTIGGSSGLYGNGMAFTADVAHRRTWSDHLTEDLELQIELLLDGVAVDYAPDARVVAEMPATFAAARSQHERWEAGRIDLARRDLPRLLAAAVRAPGRRRMALLDTAADLATPPLSVLAMLTVAATSCSTVVYATRRSGCARLGLRAGLLTATTLGVHVMAGLRLGRAPRSVYRSLAVAPLAVAWKAALWTRMIVRPRQATWTRTTRNVEAARRATAPTYFDTTRRNRSALIG